MEAVGTMTAVRGVHVDVCRIRRWTPHGAMPTSLEHIAFSSHLAGTMPLPSRLVHRHDVAMDERPSIARTPRWTIALAWLFVGAPLAWGVYETLKKALALFG